MSKIRVITLCLIKRETPAPAFLMCHHCVRSENQWFYRPLGGGVEFGETSEEAVKRELQEEIGAELTNLRFCGSLENIFTHEGAKGHEIVLVWQADLADKTLYAQEKIVGDENGMEITAVWLPLSQRQQVTIYPPNILDLSQ